MYIYKRHSKKINPYLRYFGRCLLVCVCVCMCAIANTDIFQKQYVSKIQMEMLDGLSI